MVLQSIDPSACGSSSFDRDSHGAAGLAPVQRRDLFLEALRRTEPLTRLAEQHHVSRKFIYQQMEKATAAIDQAFQPAGPQRDRVLFHLPVTQDWLEQLVLSLTLTCHSSYRGVMELLETMKPMRARTSRSLSTNTIRVKNCVYSSGGSTALNRNCLVCGAEAGSENALHSGDLTSDGSCSPLPLPCRFLWMASHIWTSVNL